MTRALILATMLAGVACRSPAPPTISNEQQTERARLRNLGKAFYENPTTRGEAVEVLRQAWQIDPTSSCDHANYAMALLRVGQTAAGVAELEQVQRHDPSLPHSYFNLAIAYKDESRRAEARAQFEGLLRLVPDEPVSWFNLGLLDKLDGNLEQALTSFERASSLAPNLAGPYFQMAATYRQLGRSQLADLAMTRFRELKAINDDDAVPEDLDWSYWAELCEQIEGPLDPSPPANRLELEVSELSDSVEAASLALLRHSEAPPEILLADRRSGLWAIALDGSRRRIGPDDLAVAEQLALADIDSDGDSDLVVVTTGGVRLLVQDDAGIFHPDPGFGAVAATALGSESRPAGVVWLDVDHDYDLDLVILGTTGAVLRNNGVRPGSSLPTWEPVPFPFLPGAVTAAVMLDYEPDSQGRDLLTVRTDGSAVLYRDRLAGIYEPQELALDGRDVQALLAADLDGDSRTDILELTGDSIRWWRNQRPHFAPPVVLAASRAAPVLADLDNRGVRDLLTSSGVERGRDAPSTPWPTELGVPRHLLAVDLDRDHRIDLVAATDDGRLLLASNRQQLSHNGLGVTLEGRKNPPLAPGSVVEVRAGRRYQKLVSDGGPMHFGLGTVATVDTVRITWANGLVQNETDVTANAFLEVREAQRLSGSCPMIYTFDGEGFRFITDVLGVAPLGASAGDGTTFPVDHDEHIQIPGDALVEHDGTLEIRIVEELREVAYLDRVELLALDRPDQLALFVNDKFQGPPFPHDLVLYGVERPIRPVAARDHQGDDVLDLVLARDGRAPEGFARTRSGIAEPHFLELAFDDTIEPNELILVLSGWVDWADGSTFLGASQTPGGELQFPALEILGDDGVWHTAIADMGMPAGKPKSIAVDLHGVFTGRSRKLRIRTNLCVSWDEVFLARGIRRPQLTETRLLPSTADLRFAGFARVIVDPERRRPESFVYADRSPTSMWNPTPGLYTRFGDVVPLLREADDQLVVMGSGDEIRLLFDATALPPLPPGWQRDWVLRVDGWAKDADANTIAGQTVEPLPFRAMASYPEEGPDNPEVLRSREIYNTRPALVLNRPLAVAAAATASRRAGHDPRHEPPAEMPQD